MLVITSNTITSKASIKKCSGNFSKKNVRVANLLYAVVNTINNNDFSIASIFIKYWIEKKYNLQNQILLHTLERLILTI